MKSIKLTLAALMLTAAFTACTKEEFAPTQEIQKDEFVGAKLIGSNLSVNLVRDGETRVDANGNWEKGDEAGLGWVINGSVGAEQTTTAPTSSNLYANHLFVKGDGDFVTYGNVYEGWHFGYYPYAYQPQMGVEMKVVLNPTQEDTYDVDQYKNRLHLSARQFLTAEDNLDGRALVNTELKLRRAVKTLKVTLKPDASFTQSSALSDLAITKVQFDYTETGVNPFYVGDNDGKVALALQSLAEVTNNAVTEKYDEAETEKAFYEALSDVWTNATAADIISTTVDNSNINLSGDQVVRFYTLPNEVTVDKTKLKLTVNVEAGYFEITYVDPNSDDYDANVDGKNNEYLEKLANAYNNNKGYMKAFTADNDMQVLGLEFKLTSDMFHTSFANISSEKAWNKAVAMVDALGIDEEVEFTIVKNGTKTWSFEDFDKDGNLINLPKNAPLTVNGADQNLILDAVGQWPTSEDFTVNMNIEVRKDLTVEGVMNVEQGYMIYNGAVITAGKEAEIGTRLVKADGTAITGVNATFTNNLPKSVSGLTANKPGTVVVDYGAYVYPAANQEGVIAYAVESTAAADIVKLNKMIAANNDKGVANVNTLIVRTELDLNALAVEGVEGSDRYENNGIDGSKLSALNGIDIMLESGAIVHKLAGSNTQIWNVTAVSGVNTIDDVIVSGNITVNSGATLNINNTVVDLPKTYFYTGNIENKGTLNTNNVSLNVTGNIVNKGSMSVANGDVWYTGSITQDGSQSGKVQPGQSKSFVANTEAGINDIITKAAEGSTIKLASDITLAETPYLTISKTLTVDLNGKTIENKTNTSDYCMVFYVNAPDKTVTIKGNGIAKASGKVAYTFTLWAKAGEVVIDNGTFTNDPEADGSAVIYVQGATTKLTINGGSFKAGKPSKDLGNAYAVVNIADDLRDADYNNVQIKGGEFYKWDPSNITHEGGIVTSFLAPQPKSTQKYISEKSGDWYVAKLINL